MTRVCSLNEMLCRLNYSSGPEFYLYSEEACYTNWWVEFIRTVHVQEFTDRISEITKISYIWNVFQLHTCKEILTKFWNKFLAMSLSVIVVTPKCDMRCSGFLADYWCSLADTSTLEWSDFASISNDRVFKCATMCIFQDVTELAVNTLVYVFAIDIWE